MSLGHHQPPDIRLREFDIAVFVRIRKLAERRIIQQPFVEFLHDLLGVA